MYGLILGFATAALAGHYTGLPGPSRSAKGAVLGLAALAWLATLVGSLGFLPGALLQAGVCCYVLVYKLVTAEDRPWPPEEDDLRA
jgi:hypothetical protein